MQHIFTLCGSCTHQFQAECASVSWSIVHCTVTLLVSHCWISIVPQQVLHTPERDKRQKAVVGAPHSSVGSAQPMCRRLCSGPGFDSRPGSLCCMSLPISYPASCPNSSATLSIKPKKAKKILKKKKKSCSLTLRILWCFINCIN